MHTDVAPTNLFLASQTGYVVHATHDFWNCGSQKLVSPFQWSEAHQSAAEISFAACEAEVASLTQRKALEKTGSLINLEVSLLDWPGVTWAAQRGRCHLHITEAVDYVCEIMFARIIACEQFGNDIDSKHGSRVQSPDPMA